jgi:hypothetical protein
MIEVVKRPERLPLPSLLLPATPWKIKKAQSTDRASGTRSYPLSAVPPAADRRVCLMQDPIYRMDVACAAMGYYQVPMTSYDPAMRKQ